MDSQKTRDFSGELHTNSTAWAKPIESPSRRREGNLPRLGWVSSGMKRSS